MINVVSWNVRGLGHPVKRQKDHGTEPAMSPGNPQRYATLTEKEETSAQRCRPSLGNFTGKLQPGEPQHGV